jgi:hypothetical protein
MERQCVVVVLAIYQKQRNIHNHNTRGTNDYYTLPVVSAKSKFSFIIKFYYKV